jgi:hypothetical protein
MTLLKDLIDIPTTTGADDFVVKLTDARTRAAQTLAEYVPTEAVVAKMNEALGRIDEACRMGKSLATYLHGSFGSGKSHFMAVMSLLLEGAPEALAKTDLAPVIAKNPWLGKRKVLVLGFHMLAARSIEDRVLGGYLAQVREKRPDTPAVPLFRSEKVFEMARAHREQLGDEKFFAQFRDAGSGWGEFGGDWDAARFDRALAADENDPERRSLLAALLETPSMRPLAELFSQGGEEFVPFDEGLKRITSHARALKYECIVLCLDELILWLAQHATEQEFLNREIEKLVQLVEANAGDRELPIVSFVARQRNLSELISTVLPNIAGSSIYAKLQHHEARFGSPIELPDSDLATIAEKRLLTPRDAGAKSKIDQAFTSVMAMRGDTMQTLSVGASQAQFRKVYPFTPAVVDVLVAASGLMQRDRTALKVMRELLVKHRDTLVLESVVPMGDLFDELAIGTLAIDEHFKIRFGRAKRLWNERIAPVLERKFGVHPDVARAQAAENPKARACLGIARVVKTLLLANVVEARNVLADLDLRRVVQLNHGSIRAPLPDGEAAITLTNLRELATEIPEIKINDQQAPGNPKVAVVPTDHDLTAIVKSAAEFESQAAKVRTLRRMVLQSIGIDESAVTGQLQPIHECSLDWRRTARSYEVLFQNFTSLSGSDLAGDGVHWRVVVGTPLPDPGAESRPLPKVAATRTVVWTPRTFGESLQRDLGKLVRIEELLKSAENFDRHAHGVPGPDRESVKGLLREQKSSLQSRLGEALRSAYGLTSCIDGVCDDVAADGFLRSLDPAFAPQIPVATDLGTAIKAVVDQALRAQFPAHPDFDSGGVIGKAALEKILECCRRGVSDPGRRIEPDATERTLMWQIARPLGLVQMTATDGAAVLTQPLFDQLDQVRRQKPEAEIRVDELRLALDRPQARGLTRTMQDLVILLYADLMKLRCTRFGQPRDGATIGQLEPDVVLRQMPLPAELQWKQAVEVMNTVFGSGIGKVLTVHNFGRLNGQVVAKRGECATAVRELREQLAANQFAAPEGNRRKTAELAHELMKAMEGDDELARVGRIAAFADHRLPAIATSIATAGRVTILLRSTSFAVCSMIKGLTDDRMTEAQLILAKVAGCLQVDEVDASLEKPLKGAIEDANNLMLQKSDAASEPAPVHVPVAAHIPTQNPTQVQTSVSSAAAVGHRRVERANAGEVRASVEELLKLLEGNPKRRGTLHWEVFEE